MSQHYKDSNLIFLAKKIREIKTALFKTEINSNVLLPNNIVQVLEVENEGTVWFLTSCNIDNAKNIDPFFAYLEFYKKGADYRLQLNGEAFIEEDENDVFLSLSSFSKNVAGNLVLVKMKIQQAEYFENRSPAAISFKEMFKTAFNWFSAPPHKVYNLS